VSGQPGTTDAEAWKARLGTGLAGRLEGKTALVFGAGSIGPGWGNGKAAAVAYAAAGASVIAVDRNGTAAEETAATIRELGHRCLPLEADATESAQVQAIVARTQSELGRIDILHNNIGFPENGGPVELPEEAWDRAMASNLKTVFLATRHVLPIMEAQRSGAIVNISSLAGHRWSGYNNVSYYAAKAGVNQFTQAVAMQYAASGIRANAILPGFMDTPLIYTKVEGRYADVEGMIRDRNARVPMGFMGDAWDVAHAAVFLASDEARYITGVLLPVDGGMSCRSIRPNEEQT
jgi:NAD(P)-dependent dehydrogenase (short-subunit alcohol dehydrogenase family)